MENQHHPPIAIVSAAGIFPGADDLDQFWRNVIDGKSAIGPVPPERWPVPREAVYAAAAQPDKARSLKAGLIHDLAFEPHGFALPPETLARLDPMHHLVLQTGRRAWQECRREQVDPRRVAIMLAAIALPTEAASRLTRKVFTQAMASRLFQTSTAAEGDVWDDEDLAATGVTSFPAALLGAALNLGGGTLTLDAACASSLFALKLGCDALHAGRADAVLAGGVARPDNLYTQIGFTQLQALSPSGRCAPFDGSADGLVVGEGCGIFVLKRLEDALQQGDTIRGVIRAIGLSNDMRGNLLAPDAEGQLRAMRAAYAAAGWNPQDVDLIECHGAATPVGDGTELRSLRALWGADGWQIGQCAIGSVKSMIGHLLTAAGAAGLIKVLLGLRHEILPPSLNFREASPESPLHDSPFRVQTAAAPWRRGGTGPRRAAVSAFGFGGINAHLLLEEWRPSAGTAHLTPAVAPRRLKTDRREPIAVVGMEALLGPADGLKAFREIVFKGLTAFQPPSASRWKNCGRWMERHFPKAAPLRGAFLDRFAIDLADVRIPPKEIPDILPQHLLMLKVAAAALRDAGLPLRQERPRMGCIIGIEFDLENTNFHLRWDMRQIAESWNRRYDLGLGGDRIDAWAASLADVCAPPLTHTRTLGSLGGLIASRIAREFRFGGPSFTVSDDAASGLKALAIAVDWLQQGEVDAMLVGAVDLPGDLRRIVKAHRLHPYTGKGAPRSLDREADGTLPGEGAVALALKPLTAARRDGDRIYALLRGLGAARGGRPLRNGDLADALSRAISASLDASEVLPADIGYVETHGSGQPAEDGAEHRALRQVFAPQDPPPALGSLKACLGHAGAAAGLAGFVKTALCLHHAMLPPLPGYRRPPETADDHAFAHVPVRPVFWPVDSDDYPRRACLQALTAEGNAVAAVLEEAPSESAAQGADGFAGPAGAPDHGLFVLHAEDHARLAARLEVLAAHFRRSRASGHPIGTAAQEWHHRHRPSGTPAAVMAFSLNDYPDFDKAYDRARGALQQGTALPLGGLTGCHFNPRPPGAKAMPALVYPGSGNAYIGMGRQLSVHWPQIWRQANRATDRFASQCRPACLVPYRSDWSPGWRAEAQAAFDDDPLNGICGQVVFGCLATDLLQHLGIVPSAVIGYSLGETVGYFATGAWPERGRMLERLEASDLFRRQLAGPCLAVRQALRIAADIPVAWRTAVINRPAARVQAVLPAFPAVRLLIVNTPDECVIGGHGPQVAAFVQRVGCEAVYLEGVVAVHCEAVEPVAEAYRDLHRFPTTPPPGIAYYSCARGERIALTTESAADSLLHQALHGFDFPSAIAQAHADGVRLFLEVGPQSSCTRMIRRILEGRPHLALSLSIDPQNEIGGLARALAVLAAEGLPVDLDRFFPSEAPITVSEETSRSSLRPPRIATIDCGGTPLDPPLPALPVDAAPPGTAIFPAPGAEATPATACGASSPSIPDDPDPARRHSEQTTALIENWTAGVKATGDAHRAFLALCGDIGRQCAAAIDLQARLVERAGQRGLLPELPAAGPGHSASTIPEGPPDGPPTPDSVAEPAAPVAFDREMCLEFAVGSAARVLGPEFAAVDRFPARVRLPDEPLMLVDRIVSVEGQKGVLGPGRLVTEHDVRPDAWYLDGGRAPVCIAVEAGQADLFLCAYLGIDLEVRGERTYRLLDAAVTFHRGLPRPGEVIRYTITIDKFIRQGATWLFFFHFDGTVDGQPLISMRSGCAGFFTAAEVRNSGGVLLKPEDRAPRTGLMPPDWRPLVPMAAESYDEAALAALRRGDMAACFGAPFEGIRLPEEQRLPGGRMALIDRVIEVDPAGGRYGLGCIRAQADIRPDAWFLTCHFVDDMVMPGTLMYECCAHALRVLLQRMGWISDRPGVVFEPVVGRQAVLKCRGPVTPATRQVVYEVEISAIGFDPEPFVTADAHMFADGHRIVMFRGMSMKMSGLDRAALEAFWAAHRKRIAGDVPGMPLFSRERLLAFATGRPSEAFGAPYRPFDHARFIARLPAPPYAFIHRVTHAEPPPWVLAPDGWVTAECDIDSQDWYFRGNGAPFLPMGILMEIALQGCGFLAAYMGSALKSEKDLHFRNLDGEAVLHANVRPAAGTLRTRVRLLQHNAAGDLLIEHYQFEVTQSGRRIYDGKTSFGFFTAEALSHQTGLPGADRPPAGPSGADRSVVALTDTPPLSPEDPRHPPAGAAVMPSRALRMIDRIDHFVPQGGPAGLGYVSGSKDVNPAEWFFKAHFFQDPVCPGSLGIESFIQLLRFAAGAFWPDRLRTHSMALLTTVPHSWRYRGQILPTNERVAVEAFITQRRDRPHPRLVADGYLKCDGLYIYKLQDFGLELLPRDIP